MNQNILNKLIIKVYYLFLKFYTSSFYFLMFVTAVLFCMGVCVGVDVLV